MAILTSAGVEWADPVVPGSPPGRTTGRVAVTSARNRRLFGSADTNTEEIGLTVIDVTPASGPAATPVILTSLGVETKLNVGEDWFDKIHIYPGSETTNPNYLQDFEIQFDNILAQEDREFLLFSAYRHDSVTLNTITNNVTPGVEFPNITPPVVVGPMQSILEASSTFNVDLTTGLGTQVREVVRALLEGLANFDDSVVFNFSTGDQPLMILSGQRVAVLLARPEMPYDYTLEFFNDSIPSSNGKVQRLSVRPLPREIYRFNYRLDGLERQRLQNYLFDRQASLTGLPLYDEELTLLADAPITSTSFTVTDGDVSDFRIGGLVMIHESDFVFEVFIISTVSAVSIGIAGQTVNAYTALNATVVPVRVVWITNVPNGASFVVDGADLEVEFTVDDLETGAPSSSSIAWNSNTYLGLPLLDECNLGLTSPEGYESRVVFIDNDTGLVHQGSLWESNKRTSRKSFSMRNRVDIRNLRSHIRYVEGIQKSFYLPTFQKDFTIGADISLGAAIVDVSKFEYRRFTGSRTPRNTIRFIFNDGSPSEIKVIDSAADHPTDELLERLTLSTTWGANHAEATIDRIEFIELVHFTTSRFVFRVQRIGLARLSASVQTLFDER